MVQSLHLYHNNDNFTSNPTNGNININEWSVSGEHETCTGNSVEEINLDHKLQEQNDWEKLVYTFRLSESFENAQAPQELIPNEITSEEFAILIESLRQASFPITIEIKPGSNKNQINLNGKGVIPVAILSTESFDATTLDVTSLQLGPGQATETHNKRHVEDIDEDGLADVMLHFRVQDIMIDANTTELILTGTTSDGISVKGSGEVTVKGKKISEN